MEVWKDIDGYNGKYSISNHGKIKSYAQSAKGRILYGYIDNKGYRCILLYDSPQHGKWHKIHRLVASAFIENPNDYPQVNHKDENKLNNHISNLEWCSSLYNNNYGSRIQRATAKNRCCSSTSKQVRAIDECGNSRIYKSIGEAERITGLSHSNIVRTLKGRTPRCGNMRWEYIDKQTTDND